jgi:alpha-ribazole phosphatase/probable phosphoglycerate mutase
MSRLVLVRHAEPEETSRGRCYGSLDVGLSAAGRVQAARLARALEPFELDAIYASPRTRAVETAAPLAGARGLEVAVEDDLRELDFGRFEGRTYEEIERSEPALFRAWMETPTEVRFPEGESYADLRVRATRVLDAIRRAHERALVVTHGGVIRAGLATWLELPERTIFRLAQSYCGVTVVDWIDEAPVLRLLNGFDSVPT